MATHTLLDAGTTFESIAEAVVQLDAILAVIGPEAPTKSEEEKARLAAQRHKDKKTVPYGT
jgi:hypothetical protein